MQIQVDRIIELVNKRFGDQINHNIKLNKKRR